MPGLLLQMGCGGVAFVLALLARWPLWAISGLAVLFIGCMFPVLMAPDRRLMALHWGVRLGWIATGGLAVGFLATAAPVAVWDVFYAVLFWFAAATVGLACREAGRSDVGLLGEYLMALWAVGGVVIWIGAAWLNDESLMFYLGLLFLLVWLIAARIRFPMPMSFKLGLHTLILSIVLLPLVDLFVPAAAVHGRVVAAETARIYSPLNAQKDPAEFARWWGQYLEQWDLMAKDVFMPDPEGVLPFRLRPNSQGFLFRSRISINSLGLRGPEFPLEKGGVFRIVALGESTTFGCTLNAGDRPWPELLEQMIRERLHPGRPVQVINAGVPAYTLSQNVGRLTREILPLKPDMIISYHGYNGFKHLVKSLPRSQGQPPVPAYKSRPLRLLAQVEYRLKMDVYKSRIALKTPPLVLNPLETEYSQAYHQFIEFARTHHIRLALANFSMAVNEKSTPEMVRFYQAGFPLVKWEIRANQVHSLIVKKMVQAHPEVSFIDTHTNLDGCSDKYIDLVHFTQEGRQQLAETIFAGIQKELQQELKNNQ